MLKYYIFDPSVWELAFDCTPYKTYPKRCQHLRAWVDTFDLAFNLCYFNFDTVEARKANASYRTLQYLHIDRLGGDVAYGGTVERVKLPNGDSVAGWTLGIRNGNIIETDTRARRARNGFGLTQEGRYIVAQSDEMTLKAFCQAVNRRLDVKVFLLMDGGGSVGTYSARSKMLFAPEKEGTNGRAVASVLLAKYKGEKIHRTLRMPSFGDDVKLLQTILGTVEADGIYGPTTKKAVIQAQRNLGLDDDGIAGPLTLKALGLK